MHARSLQAIAAELTGAIGPGERHDNEIVPFDGTDVRANRLDYANSLVPHDTTLVVRLHRLVWPEVAAANTGPGDGDDRIGRFDNHGVWHVLDTDVARAEHYCCSHNDYSVL